MGLLWKRDWVRWKGDRGIGRARLAGKRRYAKTKGEVDFWAQTGIYSLYADYRLVYVGQAGLSDKSCLGNRLKAHLLDDLAGRWDMFSWFGLQKVRTTDNKVGNRKQVNVSSRSHLANVLEGIIIEVAEPPMNSQKGRFGKRVERYIQVDDSVELAAETQKEILGKVEELDEQIKKTRKQLKEVVRQASSTMQIKIGSTRKRLTKAIKKVSK